MGNYERTCNAIDYYDERIAELKDALKTGNYDQEDKDALIEELAELEQSLGECEGYLQELASMDGYSSYEEMMYECMRYEEV